MQCPRVPLLCTADMRCPGRTSADEIVAAVFGRAGLQTYYAREMINNIGFVIFDTVKENVRIDGVSGPDNSAYCYLTMGRPLSDHGAAACFLGFMSTALLERR